MVWNLLKKQEFQTQKDCSKLIPSLQQHGPCADALMKLQTGGSVLDKMPPTPVIFGVLTTDTREQAMARSGGEKENKGADCAEAAVEMANLLKEMRGF